MGFFKDVRKLTKTSKEVSKDFDPAAQMRQATEQMQQMTQQSQLIATGVLAQATVNGVRDTGTHINLQPVVEVDLTVFPSTGPPFAATVTTQGHAQLASLQPGITVQVHYDPGDHNAVAIG